MDSNDAVLNLYERYPYPSAIEDLSGLIAGTQLPSWNPQGSFSLYFCDQEPREDLEVLTAGCGTNIAQQHAAYLLKMRFVAIDIADKPLEQARKVAERYVSRQRTCCGGSIWRTSSIYAPRHITLRRSQAG